MSERIERKLVLNEETCLYDYAIGDDGDFVRDESYDSDIVFSLLVDGRASSDQISQPEDRRGWIGDVNSTLTNYLAGSKLWLKKQSRFTQETANDCRKYAEDALKWVTRKGIADRVSVTTSMTPPDSILIYIIFYVGTDISFRSSYEIWKRSEIPQTTGDF